jgi:uncharacterized membrane protein YccC
LAKGYSSNATSIIAGYRVFLTGPSGFGMTDLGTLGGAYRHINAYSAVGILYSYALGLYFGTPPVAFNQSLVGSGTLIAYSAGILVCRCWFRFEEV